MKVIRKIVIPRQDRLVWVKKRRSNISPSKTVLSVDRRTSSLIIIEFTFYLSVIGSFENNHKGGIYDKHKA